MICETQVCCCNRPDKTLRMQRRKKEDRCWCRQGQGRIRLLTRIRWAFWDKSYGRATRETNHNSCCVKSGDRRVDVARFGRCCCLWKRSRYRNRRHSASLNGMRRQARTTRRKQNLAWRTWLLPPKIKSSRKTGHSSSTRKVRNDRNQTWKSNCYYTLGVEPRHEEEFECQPT